MPSPDGASRVEPSQSSAARDIDRITSLAAMARALGQSADLRSVLVTASDEALLALEAVTVSVSRLEAGTGIVRTILNAGDLGPTEEPWPENETYLLSEFTQLAMVVNDLRPWLANVDDPESDASEVRLLHQLGRAASLAAPIIVDGTLWGELYATRDHGQEKFVHLDVAYCEALAALLAGAISRAQKEQTLGELAYRDALTGLPNRRALDETAAAALAGGDAVAGSAVSIVIADVNGLKRVNDTFGHDAGDVLLRSVAGVLQRTFGDLHGSLVARMGGDEFAVLAVGHDVERVLFTAERACAGASGLATDVGLSCGVASATDLPEGTMRDLFSAADRALYVAKASGGGVRRAQGGVTADVSRASSR